MNIIPNTLRVCLTIVGLLVATTSFAATLTVDGKDNINADRKAIQRAIDKADPGDVILLKGTFQLDGTSVKVNKSDLTVEGEVDGDGNPTTLIKGILDANGNPVTEFPGSGYINRGIEVQATPDNPILVSNVVVKDLKMDGHNRTVSMSSVLTSSNLCADIVTSLGVKDIIVENIHGDNNVRGPQSFGAAENVEFRDLNIENTHSIGMIISGGTAGCYLQDSQVPDVTIPVVNGICQNNTTDPLSPVPANGLGCPVCDEDIDPADDPDTECDPSSDVALGNLNNAVIADSFINVLPIGPISVTPIAFNMQGDNSNVLLEDNTFAGGIASVALFGASTNVILTHNLIKDGGNSPFDFLKFSGLYLSGTGHILEDNQYENNFAGLPIQVGDEVVPADIWLRPGALDNIINESKDVILLDDSDKTSDNKVHGRGALKPNM